MIAPMKARDLKPWLHWDAPDPFTGIGEYLTPAWAAEPKLDGCRAQLTLGATVNGFGGTRASSFPRLRDAVVPVLAGTVLDGELVAPARPGAAKALLGDTAGLFNSGPGRAAELQRCFGPATFHVFDVPVLAGVDITSQPWESRRECLDVVVAELRSRHPDCHVELVPTLPATGEAIRGVLGAGGEGVMLKRRGSRYQPGKRSGDWQKVKLFATADLVLTGFYTPGHNGVKGLVGSIEVAVMLPNGVLFPVASVGNMTAGMRRHLSNPDGSLRMGYTGRVVEVMAQLVTARRRLRHPHLVRFRPDKTSADCGADQLECFPKEVERPLFST
jgi:ATP-dependent DNA ligase